MQLLSAFIQGLAQVTRALRHRNYRLFFFGQSISLMGTWIQRVAVGWLAYRLTGSAWILGIVGFAGQIPSFFFAPIAGALADRWDRFRMLKVAQFLAMGQALMLAALVLSGAITVEFIVILSFLLGLINAFEVTVRQSFVIKMIDEKEDLGNAIALNSTMVNGARLIGPSVAGFLVAGTGEGICFLINGLSYIPVLIALFMMRIPKEPRSAKQKSVLFQVYDGFRYAFDAVSIRKILLLLSITSLIGMPYVTLMPMIVDHIFNGGPKSLGFLMAAAGAGALLGAVKLAFRTSWVGLERRIPLFAAVFGAGLVIFGLSRIFWLSALALVISGFGMMMQMASSNTMLQAIVEEEKRGRIMSIYAMAIFGMTPFGSLLCGAMAEWLGAAWTMTFSGGICFLVALIFAGVKSSPQETSRSSLD